jgi:hypothetical protein
VLFFWIIAGVGFLLHAESPGWCPAFCASWFALILVIGAPVAFLLGLLVSGMAYGTRGVRTAAIIGGAVAGILCAAFVLWGL